jgi:hypothetical protein
VTRKRYRTRFPPAHGVPQYDRAVHRSALALAAAAVLLCAGCSSGSGDGFGLSGSGDTGLRDALARVAANDKTRQYVEYGDISVTSKLAGDGTSKKLDPRYVQLLGYGFGPISNTYRLMADKLHFDPTKMQGGIVAGLPPDHAGVLWGDYDVDAVEGALSGRHIPSEDSGDGKRWTSAGDREISPEGPLAGIAVTSELNVMYTASGTFAFSSTQAGVDSVTDPGGDTLADDPQLNALAGCLGDVTVAALDAQAHQGDPTSYGVGVQLDPDGGATEVACLAPHGGDAKRLRDRVADTLEHGMSPITRQPWRELLPHATVDLTELDSVVRIRATPGSDQPAGRVMQMMQTRDLAALATG